MRKIKRCTGRFLTVLIIPLLCVRVLGAAENWGLSFQTPGQAPIVNAGSDELRQYDTLYIDRSGDKTLYLTFDAGFENGYTAAILDVLQRQEVPAAFFLVGHYVKSAPELSKRMCAEGHIVGNHTFRHPDMARIADDESFAKELKDLEALFRETTGQDMAPYYRPPQGKFHVANLAAAKKMGYKTIFWSLAYVDWMQDKQPSREQALDKLYARAHPGAVILLHSTSRTNAEILEELIVHWKEEGYRFAALDELCEKNLAD